MPSNVFHYFQRLEGTRFFMGTRNRKPRIYDLDIPNSKIAWKPAATPPLPPMLYDTSSPTESPLSLERPTAGNQSTPQQRTQTLSLPQVFPAVQHQDPPPHPSFGTPLHKPNTPLSAQAQNGKRQSHIPLPKAAPRHPEARSDSCRVPVAE